MGYRYLHIGVDKNNVQKRPIIKMKKKTIKRKGGLRYH